MPCEMPKSVADRDFVWIYDLKVQNYSELTTMTAKKAKKSFSNWNVLLWGPNFLLKEAREPFKPIIAYDVSPFLLFPRTI